MPDLSGVVPVISSHVTTRILGAEAFIMNLDTLKTYSLNETATLIWSLIDSSRSGEEIAAKIPETYTIPPEECRLAVEKLLDSLAAEKLIVFEVSP
jgi:hypothetical protein